MQNALFRQRIEAQLPKFKCIEVPLLEQVPCDLEGKAFEQIFNDSTINEVIFNSPSAVEFGAQKLLRELPLQRYFTVGKGTAMVLESYLKKSNLNAKLIYPLHSAGSEALLELDALQHIEGKEFLIITGAQWKPLLGKELSSRGAKVYHWECYQRQKPIELQSKLSEAFLKPVNFVMLHSAHAAKYFFQELPVHIQKNQIVLIVGAQSIADAIGSEAWQDRIIVADTPLAEDMLSCMVEYVNLV